MKDGVDCASGRRKWKNRFRTVVGPLLNDKIEEVLTDIGWHPLQLIDDSGYPSTQQISNAALDSVATEIFGDKASSTK